jgi:hypothetical protein
MKPEGFRLIEFDDVAVAVPEADYPWITEWFWELDEDTGHLYRIETDRAIVLYHEILKRHRFDGIFVALTDWQLERMLGNHPSFAKLLGEWSDRAVVANDIGVSLPDPLEVLSYSLTSALYFYTDWYETGLTYTHHPDADGITPGSIYGRRRRPPIYTTLGDFMVELTGHWVFDEDSGCGLCPQTYADAIGQIVVEAFNTLVAEGNDNTHDVIGVWEEFARRESPLDVPIVLIHQLLQTYRLPE